MIIEKKVAVEQVAALAKRLHEGQVDKGGQPYFLHVEAVAKGLEPFGPYAMMLGYLHDAVEDTDTTLDDLRMKYDIPEEVVQAIALMSRNLYNKNQTYMDMIRIIATGSVYLARLGKISDNAHNSRKDRIIPDITEEAKQFSNQRYARARKILYPSVAKEDVRKILEIVNPDLLDELKD